MAFSLDQCKAYEIIKHKSLLSYFYFAAEFCPDCTHVTPSVARFQTEVDSSSKSITGFFVSSDKTKEEHTRYVSSVMNNKLVSIPYEGDDRKKLNKFFGACAGSERERLGLAVEERKSGIPSLIVVNNQTGVIVVADGLGDVIEGKMSAVEVLEKWEKVAEEGV